MAISFISYPNLLVRGLITSHGDGNVVREVASANDHGACVNAGLADAALQLKGVFEHVLNQVRAVFKLVLKFWYVLYAVLKVGLHFLIRLKEDYSAGGFETVIATDNMTEEIGRQLKQAYERKLQLPGGGNIVIDRCEAMTVIDVNTASSDGKTSKNRTVLETNLEACEEIARQARLRNLGGIILIDYIDMDSETDRSLVLNRLKECFQKDRIKTVIHGWTRLWLMEMTRKRTGIEIRQEKQQ